MMDEHASTEANQIIALYRRLIDSWNRRSAEDYTAQFAEDGSVVGFDGSQVDGHDAVAAHLRQIFADHLPASYVTKVREVRFLTPEVALLRAVVGMVPPGQTDLHPAVNAIQTLVATRRDGAWQIDLFQNTPAAFHGRQDLAEKLTAELQEALRRSPRETEREEGLGQR